MHREVNTAATTELKRLVNSLIKADDKPKVKGPCHNCGKSGHWVRDCPESKKDYKPSNNSGARNKGKWSNPKKNKKGTSSELTTEPKSLMRTHC